MAAHVRKLDADGLEIWTNEYKSPDHSFTCPQAVAVDADDAVLVGLGLDGMSYDVGLLKYAP
jgi:hypothetical protein